MTYTTSPQPPESVTLQRGSGEPRPGPAPPPFDLAFLARLALIGLVIVGVAVVPALLLSAQRETVYGARAEIAFVAGQDAADDARERELNTQRELVLSRAVITPVAQRAGIPEGDLRDAVEVKLERDDLLRVTVGDRDPERARLLAQAITDRYLSLNEELSPEARRAQVLVQREMAEAEAAARRAPETVVYSYRDRVNRLRDRLLELRLERATQAQPRPLAPAYVLEDPLSPRPLRAAAGGLAVGLVLATAVVIALARRRWRPAHAW